MNKNNVIIIGYITNDWAKRLFTHSQTIKVMGSLSGIPKNCMIKYESDEEYCQPIKIQTEFVGEKPRNYGLENKS